MKTPQALPPSSDIFTRRVVKPQDCLLAFGIPVASRTFFERFHDPQGRDFVPNCCPSWLDYYREFVSYADRLLPPIEALGVEVVRDLTLAQFSLLLARRAPSVFILFAHWKDNAVEFADGLADIASVVDAVPPSYEGIIDLCVCHPKGLALALRLKRPNCVVRFNDSESTPALWLYFYMAVFKVLRGADITYMDALEQVIDLFLNSVGDDG